MSKIIHVSGGEHITSDLLAAGPETYTITDVTEVTLEGKKRHAVHLAEIDGKTWVPALTIIKSLVELWGPSISVWKGQRVTLYRDPDVRMGKQVVGGIRVSQISGIDGKQTVTVKGPMSRPVTYTFEPVPAASQSVAMISREQWEQITTVAEEKGVTEPLAWAADQVGRALDGPQHITAEEATQLMGALKEEAQ
ncbi:hypothetical protein [uncultured Stenotrophomonas sp.]|uniref:hypothetical protein n=1 Tax=uncultured Stenotrophomonas sp. TaxID=165438 RepID=UPI0025D28C8D|nr:hypothetical protein [uncultured Stenotrophomonas sp.]